MNVFSRFQIVSFRSTATAALFLASIFIGSSVYAIDVDWKEPQVMGKSSQKGRMIVRFSGKTDPNTTIELQKGLRYYLSDGSSRGFTITSEDRNQFPMSIGGDGLYVFDLNVPVRAIEVPLLMKNGEETRQSVLNFRVPKRAGRIQDLTDLEKSYTAQATDDDDRYRNSRGKYTKKRDRGQIITSRKSRGMRNDDRVQIRSKRMNIKIYGSLGPSWTSLHQESPGVQYQVGPPGTIPSTPVTGYTHSESALAIPVWRLGAYWDMNTKWRFGVSVRDTPLIFEPDENANELTFPKGQANWTATRAEATYFLKETSFGYFGIDFGAQFHSMPYYRLRNYQATFNYEDSLMIDGFVGARLKSFEDKSWPWQLYFHVSVPFYTNSDVFSGSGVGLELGGGADTELMPGLFGGVWAYAQQYFLWTDYPHLQRTGPTTADIENKIDSDYSLTSATVEVRLTVRF